MSSLKVYVPLSNFIWSGAKFTLAPDIEITCTKPDLGKLLFDFSAPSAIAISCYLLYSTLDFIAFSVQDTTRQVVRIALLKEYGTAYDDRLVPRLQQLLTPNWTVPVTPIYLLSNVASFYFLLFNFGWGAAIAAHVLSQLALTFLPAPYSLIIPSVRRQLGTMGTLERVKAAAQGFDAGLFTCVI